MATGVRVAYLMSHYPAISHTFFLNEVAGLRVRGMHIETASINQPDRKQSELPPGEAIEAENTFYVKDGRPVAAALRFLQTILMHPLALVRGLAAWIRIRDLTLRQRLYWLFYLAEALLLGHWMKQRRLEHLHVHFGGPVASVGMLAASAWRLPFSLTIHGPEELLNMRSYHLREKLASARFVFCISDFCRSQLYQITPPEHWSKFHVIRLGVDPLMLAPQSNHTTSGIHLTASRPVEILCVGRLVPAKGHRILLEALKLLRDRDVNVRLTFIGAGGERGHLQAFVSEHALADHVSFASALSHSQTLAQLRRADIFALASFAEGIPVALMEAMSFSVPCVSTTIAGIPELIQSGIDGLLVPPGNAEMFAEALEMLATDPALRRNLGQAARQRIITQYNLPLNHDLLALTFQNCIAPSGTVTETTA